MTLAPRFLVKLWTGYCAARAVRRLKPAGHAVAAQQAAFTALLTQFAATRLGIAYRLTAETSYDQFRDAVPPHTYEFFAPLIARMQAGEADLLVPGVCRLFVETAGTTAARPKLLPAPAAMLTHFRDALRDALFLYAAKPGNDGVFLGKHLHVGASTALHPMGDNYRTSLDGVLTLSLAPWAATHLHTPPRAITDLPEGPEKIRLAGQAALTQDVTLVGGTPATLITLAHTVRDLASRAKQRATHLQAVWRNLECCAFTGAPLGLYADQLRQALGPTVRFHEIYAAAEGLFAAQDDATPGALRLLADAGVFFEFLPLRLFSEENLARLGRECLPLEKVQTGVDYVLVLTTPAGLCRYVPGDIVRFISVDPPRLQFAGRTQVRLNAFGEQVSEREVTEALTTVCQRNGWQPVNFHVAPLSLRPVAGRITNSHEWWVELRTHTVKTPTANVLAPEFDAELTRRNADYAQRRRSGALEEPSVRLVMPGVFELWTRTQRQLNASTRLPHCRGDRQIAEQLASIARYHQSTQAYPSTGS